MTPFSKPNKEWTSNDFDPTNPPVHPSTPLSLLRGLTERNGTLPPFIPFSSTGLKHLAPLGIDAYSQLFSGMDGLSPESFIAAIMALYSSEFDVSDLPQDSPSYRLGRGIRQGCPLSPYLFTIVLSTLTADLNSIFSTLFIYTPWTFSLN